MHIHTVARSSETFVLRLKRCCFDPPYFLPPVIETLRSAGVCIRRVPPARLNVKTFRLNPNKVELRVWFLFFFIISPPSSVLNWPPSDQPSQRRLLIDFNPRYRRRYVARPMRNDPGATGEKKTTTVCRVTFGLCVLKRKRENASRRLASASNSTSSPVRVQTVVNNIVRGEAEQPYLHWLPKTGAAVRRWRREASVRRGPALLHASLQAALDPTVGWLWRSQIRNRRLPPALSHNALVQRGAPETPLNTERSAPPTSPGPARPGPDRLGPELGAARSGFLIRLF